MTPWDDACHKPDPVDRAIIRATQGGMPLSVRPYHTLAESLGLSPSEVMSRLQRMQDNGAIRRIAAVPQHYALGIHANGMSVWDVDDARVDELGEQVGMLDCVSHAYRRPRHPPQWPYNLFAMVHGRSRGEVENHVAEIARLLGNACHRYDILYSSRLLKKTGLRLGG
ncbi:AsnC family transcriptional regulator [Aquisalimonas sp.]|uniref:siroheme decarboxylase subunit beta n=1 Tax=Aquisalimonas sp. TaxID=1872621 RepID=UPI0025C5F1E6|nr:AsnC family transcriptional regulator [Aquisalimonas sp.]